MAFDHGEFTKNTILASMKGAKIVEYMYQNDAFSQWLGIKVVLSEPGKSVLEMTVRPDMTNGFGIAHGGITYSLADSALAFASNAHGRQSVSVDTSISHLKPVKIGDVLTTETEEISLSDKIGVYTIKIVNQDKILVALFKGTVYRTPKEWT